MRRASIVLPKPGYIGRTASANAARIQHTEVLVFEGPRAERREEWADRMNRQNEGPPCMCGCGQRVKARAKHRTAGLPRYVHGHHPNPLRRAFENLRRRGYSLVSDDLHQGAAAGEVADERPVAEGDALQVRRGERLRRVQLDGRDLE